MIDVTSGKVARQRLCSGVGLVCVVVGVTRQGRVARMSRSVGCSGTKEESSNEGVAGQISSGTVVARQSKPSRDYYARRTPPQRRDEACQSTFQCKCVPSPSDKQQPAQPCAARRRQDRGPSAWQPKNIEPLSPNLQGGPRRRLPCIKTCSFHSAAVSHSSNNAVPGLLPRRL
jgi:hypothetical protein